MSAREELQERIAAMRPWFHSHDLGDGLRIERDPIYGPERDYPLALWERVRALLPTPPTGLRVLDVGCNSGYISFAMKQLGAASVMGVESFRPYLEQAMLVREVLDAKVDLEPLSIYELAPERIGEFDVSLCLGVAYHLRHPLLGFEKLASVTRGWAIVESAIVPTPRRSWMDSFVEHIRHPGDAPPTYGGNPRLLYFIENEPGPEGLLNWFVPTLEALVALVKASGLTEIVAARAFRDRGRGIVVARRRGTAPPRAG